MIYIKIMHISSELPAMSSMMYSVNKPKPKPKTVGKNIAITKNPGPSLLIKADPQLPPALKVLSNQIEDYKNKAFIENSISSSFKGPFNEILKGYYNHQVTHCSNPYKYILFYTNN